MTQSHSPKFIYNVNTVYEFTINPADKYQYASKGDTRFRNVQQNLKDIFQKFESPVRYHLFPEVSMPQYGMRDKNSICRCHYHGIMLFETGESLRKFLTQYWHKLTAVASIQFNEFRPGHWPGYCRKQSFLIPNKLKLKIANATWDSIVSSSAVEPATDG